MPPDEAASLARALPRLATAVQAAAGTDSLNILLADGKTAGQEVPHVHFHLIPRRPGDGLGYHWPAKKADVAVLAQEAEAIRRRLGT